MAIFGTDTEGLHVDDDADSLSRKYKYLSMSAVNEYHGVALLDKEEALKLIAHLQKVFNLNTVELSQAVHSDTQPTSD